VGGNQELIAYRLTRADETLEEARLMAASGHWHGCVNRLYYACFYAINALLLHNGLSSPKHSGARALFNKHFVAPGLVPKELATLYNTLFDSRHEADYEDLFAVDPHEAGSWLGQADQFIRHISTLINSSKTGH
jgi:uncharacterized protein (UPF0332 family)